MVQGFIRNIQKKNLFGRTDRILVAVSGGVDSVALCYLCHLSGFDFALAHCNFKLRAADSDSDELFVKQLAEKLNVPFYSKQFDTAVFSLKNKIATQEAARILRYQWFEELRIANNYKYILTAHHADDNIETVLMNFFRGTGIRGVAGIKEKKGNIIRPLLYAKRRELELFLSENNWEHVEDESNSKNDYTRNYFRNTILPLIENVYPNVKDNLYNNIARFRDIELIYNLHITQQQKKLLLKDGNHFKIPVQLLKKPVEVKTMLWELLKDFNVAASQLDEIIHLLDSESGRYLLTPTHRILKDRKHLIISAIQDDKSSIVIIEGDGLVNFAEGKIMFTKKASNENISRSADVACLDAYNISYPLLLRRWRTGDYFYPLGMQKKKKVSRFLIDQKISLAGKEKIWVVEMNKKIIWIVGQRIDDRFKITSKTQSILEIKFSQNNA